MTCKIDIREKRKAFNKKILNKNPFKSRRGSFL